ncbi:hypothetical protein L7F22_050968 [Adiantum nelumboides]|nr:hypothetical protein [Adiantum nelumboides]
MVSLCRKIFTGVAETSENTMGVTGGSLKLLDAAEKDSFKWRQATNSQPQVFVTRRSQSLPTCGHVPSSKAVIETGGLSGREIETSQHVSERPSTNSASVQCFKYKATSSTSEDFSVAAVKEEPDQHNVGPCALHPTHVNSKEDLVDKTPFADLSSNNCCQVETVNQSAQNHSHVDRNTDASCLASYNKNVSACWPVPMEGLSRILASLHGVLNRDSQTGSYFQQSAPKPSDVSQDQDLQPQNIDHGSKVNPALLIFEEFINTFLSSV